METVLRKSYFGGNENYLSWLRLKFSIAILNKLLKKTTRNTNEDRQNVGIDLNEGDVL